MFAREAEAIEPSTKIPNDLLKIIADAKREEAVAAVLAEADHLNNSGDLREVSRFWNAAWPRTRMTPG